MDLKANSRADDSSPEGREMTRFTSSGLRRRSSSRSARRRGGGAATSCRSAARSPATPDTPRRPAAPFAASPARRHGQRPVSEPGPGTRPGPVASAWNTGSAQDAEPILPERPSPRIPRARSGRGTHCACAAASRPAPTGGDVSERGWGGGRVRRGARPVVSCAFVVTLSRCLSFHT